MFSFRLGVMGGARSSLLESTFLTDPGWGALLSVPPPILVNPVEPGTVRDDTRPGTGFWPALPLGYAFINVGERDLRIKSSSYLSGAATGKRQFAGRNVVVTGLDCNANTFEASSAANFVWAAGIKNDMNGKFEDAFYLSGTPNSGDRRPFIFLGDSRAVDVNGTNRSYDAAVSVVSISVSGANYTITLSGVLPTAAVAGDKMIIYGTSVGGTPQPPREGFNGGYVVVSGGSTTTIVATREYAINPPSSGTATGGFCRRRNSIVATHGDCLQNPSNRYTGTIILDRFTGYGGYQCFISGGNNVARVEIRRSNFKRIFLDTSGNELLPFDANSTSVFLYPGHQTRITESWLDHAFATDGVQPTPDPDAVQLKNGFSVLGWNNLPQISGLLKVGAPPGGDFCPDNVPGPGYVIPGFYGGALTQTGSITDITVDRPLVASETLGLGGLIAVVDATHNLVPMRFREETIDIYLSAGNTDKLRLESTHLVRGPTGLVFGEDLVFELTASVRDQPGISFAKQFTLTVTDDLLPATSIVVGAVDADVSTTAGATHSGTNAQIGAEPNANQTRHVLVAVTGTNGATNVRTINSVTLAGVAGVAVGPALEVANPSPAIFSAVQVFLVELPAGTGTIGNWSVVWSASMANCGVQIIPLYNVGSTSPHSLDTAFSLTAQQGVSADIETLPGGASFAFGTMVSSGQARWVAAGQATTARAPLNVSIDDETSSIVVAGLPELVNSDIPLLTSSSRPSLLVALSLKGGGGSIPPASGESLDFSNSANSQYVPLI